jgi:hypothetical protein
MKLPAEAGTPSKQAGHQGTLLMSGIVSDAGNPVQLGRCRDETTVSAKLHCRGETTLANLSGILRQLKKERDRVQQQLSGLNAALEAFAGVYRNGSQPRRKMSSKGRARIAAAQRARWAKVKGQKVVPIKTGRRTMSASARRKIAAAQRARWAKVRAAKK